MDKKISVQNQRIIIYSLRFAGIKLNINPEVGCIHHDGNNLCTDNDNKCILCGMENAISKDNYSLNVIKNEKDIYNTYDEMSNIWKKQIYEEKKIEGEKEEEHNRRYSELKHRLRLKGYIIKPNFKNGCNHINNQYQIMVGEDCKCMLCGMENALVKIK